MSEESTSYKMLHGMPHVYRADSEVTAERAPGGDLPLAAPPVQNSAVSHDRRRQNIGLVTAKE